MKRTKQNEGSEDVPPTQRIPEEDVDDMGAYEEGGMEEGDDEVDQDGDVDMPDQPDLHWYLSNWDMTNQAKIAVCRTYANYLSAQQPKVVDGPRAGYKTPRRVPRKRV